MQEEYKLNIIFNDNGSTLNDLMCKLFEILVNADFSPCDNYDIMKSDIVRNL